MKLQILVDNPNSWIIPYAEQLNDQLRENGCNSVVLNDHEQVTKGDILVLLSCEQIFTNLDANEHNLVVHESNLPKGKGWSPLTWQILEGKNKIPVTLFEAAATVDSGVIYDQLDIELTGSELLEEIKHQQGLVTIELVKRFVEKYPNNTGTAQAGDSSFYKKRTEKDSELDVNKTIAEQFNALRVCDNERYPAFFEHNGHKYYIKIERK